MPEVRPISVTAIDFDPFLEVATRGLGKSPSRSLDASNQKVKTQKGYLSILKNIQDLRVDNHLSFGFAVLANNKTLQIAAQVGGVHSIIKGDFGVLTATLFIWKLAINNACLPNIDTEVRSIYCQIQIYLEQAGLNTDIRKFMLEDKTFTVGQK